MPEQAVGRVTVVVGGQFGSEGKGAVVDQLSRPGDGLAEPMVIRVAGPNAGHTVVDTVTGTEWKLRAVPVAAVSHPLCPLVIAPGSEVDLAVLTEEVDALDEAGFNVSGRLLVDEAATILEPRHIRAESEAGLTGRIGSTGKGIGAARAARLMRTANTMSANSDWETGQTGPAIRHHLKTGGQVIIEGTQGYGLGLHTKYYPQVTSSDCRAIDFLAMAGVSPWHRWVQRLKVIVVARTMPIRVAGNSGPLEGETTWEALGLPQEHTTVTHKVRRVGAWDGTLVREAVVANGGPPTVEVALTMADYLFPVIKGWDGAVRAIDLPLDLEARINAIEDEVGAPVALIGTSPSTMIEVTR